MRSLSYKEDFNKKKSLLVVLVFLFSLMLSVILVGEELAEAKDEVEAPEKKILELELEGIPYEIEHTRYISDLGYIIYIDQERYELIEYNSTDRIQVKDRTEHLPEVYMEIWKEETEPKVFSNKLEKKLRDTHGDTVSVETVNSPVDGIKLSAGSFETFWEYYYLVVGPQNDSFVIKQRIPGGESGYFEGMVPRWNIMLEELDVLDNRVDDEIQVFINDSLLKLDNPPVIQNGRTLVPMRSFFEALGAEVKWEEETRTVIGKRDDIEVHIPIGSNEPTINGETVTIEVAAQILNNRTFIPLRFVSESLGDEVHWDKENRNVLIYSEKQVEQYIY